LTYRNDGRLATSSIDIEESIHKLLINRHPRPMRFDLVEKLLDPSLTCLFMRIPLLCQYCSISYHGDLRD
jgi:hypothetical protein